METDLQIEIAYATSDSQVIVECKLAAGATALDAVLASGITDDFPEIDVHSADLGVFGKVVKRDHPLRNGDRVEIYRPLIADPKAVRRLRAAAGKRMKKGGGATPGAA